MKGEDHIKKEILAKTKTIAIVGLSDKPDRASYRVAKYLKDQGYRIVPVNPNTDEILGEKSFASILEIPFAIDLVNVFRRSEEVPGIIKEAIQKSVPVLWLQLNIECPAEGEKLAEENGLKIIKNCCIMAEHKKFAQS